MSLSGFSGASRPPGSTCAAGAGSSSGPGEAVSVHVGVVHVVGHICHVSVDATVDGLYAKLGDYVRENGPYQLPSAHAGHVRELLCEGHARRAVEHYFAHVGGKWDAERLTVVEASMSAAGGGPVDFPAPRSTHE